MIGVKNPFFTALVFFAVTFAVVAFGTNIIFAQTNCVPEGSSTTGSSLPLCCVSAGNPTNCVNPNGGPTGSNGQQVSTLTSTLCGIVSGVRTVIGVIALVMFLVGGVLYAVGHFMPAAGQIKASMQGWAMGMILGGVIGIVLVILAPFIIQTIIGFGQNITLPQCL